MPLAERSVRSLARLGDAIVNFLASALLTLHAGVPRGIKVADKLLREVALEEGLHRRGQLRPEDLFEALVGYAWLRGVKTEHMLKVMCSPALGAESEEEALKRGLAALLRDILRNDWASEVIGSTG
ncbi:MAG: hypothetical protein DRJ67_00825 [Thermoprotei archaeon]|nr:MAG: hypothetical protein DRJ67_00825 [Thermoprotei archaeon]